MYSHLSFFGHLIMLGPSDKQRNAKGQLEGANLIMQFSTSRCYCQYDGEIYG
jgi:hypothetical protein